MMGKAKPGSYRTLFSDRVSNRDEERQTFRVQVLGLKATDPESARNLGVDVYLSAARSDGRACNVRPGPCDRVSSHPRPRGIRTLRIPAALAEGLRRWKLQCRMSEHDPVFPIPARQPMHRSTALRHGYGGASPGRSSARAHAFTAAFVCVGAGYGGNLR